MNKGYKINEVAYSTSDMGIVPESWSSGIMPITRTSSFIFILWL